MHFTYKSSCTSRINLMHYHYIDEHCCCLPEPNSALTLYIKCIGSLGPSFILAYMFESWGLSETNQELIVSQGGISLLSLTATKSEDPQTLRMVAGAIANLCGNGKQKFFNSFSCQSRLPTLMNNNDQRMVSSPAEGMLQKSRLLMRNVVNLLLLICVCLRLPMMSVSQKIVN